MIHWLKSRTAARVAQPSAAPEAKTSRTGAIVALHQAGRPVWTSRNYAALARAGYMKNAGRLPGGAHGAGGGGFGALAAL